MKQMMSQLHFALAAGLLALSGLALADGQLMVMPARSTVEGKQTRKVQVSNLGDKPLYLKIDLQRIENPGENPERKTVIGDIATPGMMASPAKLTLGPGQKRDINLVALNQPEQETLYRLYIVPVSSIKVVGDESRNKITAPVTFGVGYGVVVHHLPPTSVQTHAWSHQCTATGLQLTVNGNVHSVFKQLLATPSGALADEVRVYPGTPRIFPVKTLKGNVDGKAFDVRCP
nr:pilus assembly protein [Serratia fonticola]